MRNPYTVMKEKPAEFFHLIPQTGVTHIHCTEDPQHNAVWDMAISPEGRIFFSACGESYLPLFARLYEYDHANKKMIRHFALEDKIIMNKTALCTSKFHTAMSFIGDGRILSATHTTSPAPSHPTWMPYEYADHPYEGYQGSELLEYNYITGEVKGLGTISPHDTVYGATYDPKNGDYLCITWMRGTGYVYNIHTGSVRCLGQLSDSHTSRTFLLSDGHIYGSTYSGAMFRYNTDIRDIEWLGVDAPGLIRHAVEHNGILYFTTGPCSVPGRGQMLYAYNMKTREITEVGRPVPEAEPLTDNAEIFYNAYGMAMDSKGRLWYGCQTFIPELRYVGDRLYMWDFLSGKAPVDCGFLGTPKRTLSISAEIRVVNDVLIISDGNHTSHEETLCGILAIDLEQFVPALETEKRLFSHDYINYLPYPEKCLEYYPKDDLDECLNHFHKFYKETIQYFLQFHKDNTVHFPFPHRCGASVWQQTGRENAAVQEIRWTSNNALSFWCGKETTYRADCTVDGNGDVHVTNLEKDVLPAICRLKADVSGVKLPCIPGRRYIADAEASVFLPDGSILAGTHDTMLAKIRDGKVFNLGQVCSAGGIHQLDVAPNGTAWGIAGHAEGVGQLFTYDDEKGIDLLGKIPEAFAENGRNVALFRPTTLALSPDGKYLAVGGEDEMGGIVVLAL